MLVYNRQITTDCDRVFFTLLFQCTSLLLQYLCCHYGDKVTTQLWWKIGSRHSFQKFLYFPDYGTRKNFFDRHIIFC